MELVQYEPQRWTLREKGRFLPETRVSERILHLGALVGALEPAMKFYRDVLGFQEFWRGSSSGKALSWVNMRVPDGDGRRAMAVAAAMNSDYPRIKKRLVWEGGQLLYLRSRRWSKTEPGC